VKAVIEGDTLVDTLPTLSARCPSHDGLDAMLLSFVSAAGKHAGVHSLAQGANRASNRRCEPPSFR